MNKALLIVLILSLFNTTLQAQKLKHKRAAELYETYSYKESIKRYEEITDKSTDIKRKLAQSYYNIGNFKKAEKYYAEVCSAADKKAEDLYSYAAVLAINKEYEESVKWMKEYNKLVKNDSRSKRWLENSSFYKDLQKDKGIFKIENLNINTNQEDFGTAYYKDKIVFASTREGIEIIRRKWNWNDLPFLNLFIATPDTNLHFKDFKLFYKKVNKKFHEGPASFSKDGNFMAFTRNNYHEKSSDGVIKLEIYTSEYKNGKWQKPVPLHFNSKEYSVGHPSLTPDGKTMYLASDMPGGIGGVDIYVIHRKDDGSWTDPENLGKTINTEGNEMFPFIHPEGFLIYSSNGLPGLGGLDVFVALKDGNKFKNPENLGVPINSNYDDFALILDDQQESGYFSSNRVGGKGDDDIYLFRLLRPLNKKLIEGVAKDQNGNILSGVEVNLYDENGNVIATVVTGADGKYQFEAEPNKFYSLDGTKPEYKKGTNTADTHTDDYIIEANLVLEISPKFSLYCIIKDEQTMQPLDSVKISMVDKIKNKTEIIYTPKTGDFYRKLNDRQLNDSLSYELTLEKKGYLTKKFVYNQKLYKEGQYNMHEEMNFLMQKIEKGVDLGKIININPIYFDLNKSDIRPDAAIELDKIVKVMNDNPTMVIELGSHTDCRGSKEYNRKLSDRRAKSSAAYIKARITNPERIYGKGYGESQLVNKCECEGSRKVPCTEKEHQQNRRTEFKIIKM